MHVKTLQGQNLKSKPLDFMSINNSLLLTKNYTLTINKHLVNISIACKTDVTIYIKDFLIAEISCLEIDHNKAFALTTK